MNNKEKILVLEELRKNIKNEKHFLHGNKPVLAFETGIFLHNAFNYITLRDNAYLSWLVLFAVISSLNFTLYDYVKEDISSRIYNEKMLLLEINRGGYNEKR